MFSNMFATIVTKATNVFATSHEASGSVASSPVVSPLPFPSAATAQPKMKLRKLPHHSKQLPTLEINLPPPPPAAAATNNNLLVVPRPKKRLILGGLSPPTKERSIALRPPHKKLLESIRMTPKYGGQVKVSKCDPLLQISWEIPRNRQQRKEMFRRNSELWRRHCVQLKDTTQRLSWVPEVHLLSFFPIPDRQTEDRRNPDFCNEVQHAARSEQRRAIEGLRRLRSRYEALKRDRPYLFSRGKFEALLIECELFSLPADVQELERKLDEADERKRHRSVGGLEFILPSSKRSRLDNSKSLSVPDCGPVDMEVDEIFVEDAVVTVSHFQASSHEFFLFKPQVPVAKPPPTERLQHVTNQVRKESKVVSVRLFSSTLIYCY